MTSRAVAHDPSERRVAIPRKCAFLFKPWRYKVLYGGRGAAKSHSIGRALLILAIERRLRILCAREIQKSIRDSVHKLLKDLIVEMRLQANYRVTQHAIYGGNGSEFIFTGLDKNIETIKSYEGVDIVWVEEAERVSEQSWRILIPTIRAEGSEIWVNFNPKKETDPAYRRFITDPPPNAKVVKMTWRDNKWFPDVLAKERDFDFARDPEAAQHVWEGGLEKFGAAQIMAGVWTVEEFEPDTDEWGGPYYGADWGYVDPTALVKAWVDMAKRTIYVEEEAYQVGAELDEIPALFGEVTGSKSHTIRADNSRPETISSLTRNGFPKIEPCEKWPGSVDDGIAYLRSFDVVVHPRCKHVVEEFKLYSRKIDKLTGEVLPDIIDKHNHCVDALRYALQPLIMASSAPVSDMSGLNPDRGHRPRDTA